MLGNIKAGKNALLIFSVVAFLAVAAGLGFSKNETPKTSEEILKCTVKNLDGEIRISWNLLSDGNNIDGIEISLKNHNAEIKETFSADAQSYSFTSGKHGTGYNISVRAMHGKDIVEKFETRAVFLNYDKLPALPIISIDTRNGKSPTYKAINHPEGMLGATITDNDFLDCEVKMSSHGVKIVDSRAKIRIRGNTSAVRRELKKPYGLKLDRAADLLELGNEYADKDWTLLYIGTDLKTYFATALGNLFDVGWQPRMRFVNIMLNDEWRGLYILIESVKRGVNRENISKDGYIFECDPYFWAPDTKYFKTASIGTQHAFTFKYPKKNRLSNYKIQWLKNYLEQFEKALNDQNESYADYIDVNSFAKWILIQDILGNQDGAGSNMYFNKYDFDLNNPTSTKIKMGPLWDFDLAFSYTDKWSGLHHYGYFPRLFKLDSFRQAYKDNWYAIKKKIIPTLRNNLKEFDSRQIRAIQKSRELDVARWNKEVINFKDEMEEKVKWIENRMKWINQKVTADDWK